MYYGSERERELISLMSLRFNSCLIDLPKRISLYCSNDIKANLFLVYIFFCHREINSNDEQVQSCVEDYLEVITSVLSEKR